MKPLKVAIIAGEESGDILGADLIRALAAQAGQPVDVVGVGGTHLAALGLVSLFDPARISLMGLTAILARLPSLIPLIRRTADAIVRERPDVLLLVDSPGFNLRVARRVRAADPSIPIVKYVSPSVWAYWPGRARRMKPHVDHVLCLLPFEPEVLRRLGGPDGTYVGHRLVHDTALQAAAAEQAARGASVRPNGERTLLVLPGSRRSEVKALMQPFGRVVSILHERGNRFELVIPTVPHVASLVAEGTRDWPVRPRLVQGTAEKWGAFGAADAAIAASGTVSLELALAGVPLIACYRTDVLVRLLEWQITIWSASLPNIVADEAVVPEFYDGAIRPPMLARYLESLMGDEDRRRAMKAGFGRIASAMQTTTPASEIAAGIVLDMIARRSRA